ncbi:MAG: AAA family ATPase [Lewinellaceae bacterium]|nr:AAA family ATPase [Lewinellaceae bacterium]
MSVDIAPLLYKEVLKTLRHPHWLPAEKVLALGSFLEKIFLEATKQEQLAFSTLFARISYAGHQFHIQPETLQVVHHFRRLTNRARNGVQVSERDVRLGAKALAETILVLYQSAIPDEMLAFFPQAGEWRFEPPEQWEYKSGARVVAVRDIPEDQALIAVDEEDPSREVRVLYGLSERNDNFNPSIQLLRKVFTFPVTLMLHEVDIDRSGQYRPRVFVVEPDYLVDISAIAEAFKEHGAEPLSYLLKKFLPYEVTTPILVGNIANFFLDRLLQNKDAAYMDLFRETFRLYPFVYAPMTDAEVRDVSAKSQKHYLTLKAMASGGFAQQGIDPEHCILEPSFYSQQYGIQGRLDLLYKKGDVTAIVELKSGKAFKPNSYGIQRSHFTQTLLYDLLVRSVFGAQTDPVKYILYSGAELNPLRFAPTVAPEQWEAIQVRNHLVAIERLLAGIPADADRVPLLERLNARNGTGKGFLQRDMTRFETVYAALSPLEKKYFNSFTGFIARENMLAKIGEADSENINGHAALWRNSFAEKQQAFAILSHLEILENKANASEASIVFRKTAHTNPLANFRVGDIAVLYPVGEEGETVLNHQVIKCTITALNQDTVAVQLRYQQFNRYPFEGTRYWNLEPDMLETGFVGMYRSLFEWAAADPEKRRRVLLPDPGQPIDTITRGNASITSEGIAKAVEKIVQSPHFFLLWGPPGTGKTSVLLKALAGWILDNSSDNLLLLAYTNRAVDEICEALESMGEAIRNNYLRIGSQHATAPRFREQLLQQRIADVDSRSDLRMVLEKRRIVVGTVASIAQNDSLLRLKKFQRLIIDEASQLLEPQLLGLLTRFEHFILIGDHRQLPAVTGQPATQTKVRDGALNDIGLRDMRDSYFERLYRRCVAEKWDWAYGCLDRQGRMHQDIMYFPSRYFYDGMLQTLKQDDSSQSAALSYVLPAGLSPLEQQLANRRVAFLGAPAEEALPGQKTSTAEATMVVALVQFYKKLYAANNKDWNPVQSLGIITPWRAQIAQIRESLMAAGLDPEEMTIDTVERYQGGAREVIIVSCCVHHELQLASLVSLSEEGVDRKLNVALTRARQHLCLIGNKSVLERDERYRAFIEAYALPTEKQ